jgi:hypothetical protein
MVDFCKWLCFHWFMKADLRISIKDYSPPSLGCFGAVSPVSLSRVFTALRKGVVRAA